MLRTEPNDQQDIDDSFNINDASENIGSISGNNSTIPNVYINLFAFAVINARSISAKVGSLVDLFTESEISLACVSETWLQNGPTLDSNVLDLEESHNISLITKNRSRRGGGVAIAYDKNKVNLKKVFSKYSTQYEIVCASGQTRGTRRKIFAVSYYIPPDKKASESEKILECIDDLIGRARTEWEDPIIVVGGDANRRPIENSYIDYPDINDVQAGPSRNGQFLLRCATNIRDHIAESYLSPPLQVDSGELSDHHVLVFKSDLPKRDIFEKRTFAFRPYNKQSEEKFGKLLLQTDWTRIETGETSTAAELFATILQNYVDVCFPIKKKTIKSTDLPWATTRFKRKVRQRRRKFRRSGRCAAWKKLKIESEEILREEKASYLEKIEKTGTNGRNFYQMVNKLKHRETPKPWSINELFPGEPDGEIAEKIANFFNGISHEYDPVPRPDPVHCSQFRKIEPYEISARLKNMKKPKSRLFGDIDPRLNVKYCDVLAFPLAYLFNLTAKTGDWPSLWKLEMVTVIPKNSCPASMGELRNLSCTPLYSKLLETFVLEELKKKVKLSDSQYGGMKGCGVDHFLVDTWHQILNHADDHRAGTNLVSIDFEKAFNRMDHQHCLNALQAKGATAGPLAMVNAFLCNRRMSVKIGETASAPRDVPGGSPQGSILANFLFCATVDSLSNTGEAIADSPERRIQPIPPIGSEVATYTPLRQHRNPDVEQYVPGAGLLEQDEEMDESFRFFRLRRPYVLDSSDDESFVMPQAEINDILGAPERWEQRIQAFGATLTTLTLSKKCKYWVPSHTSRAAVESV